MEDNKNQPVVSAAQKPVENSAANSAAPVSPVKSQTVTPIVQTQPASNGPVDRNVSSPSRTLVGNDEQDPSVKAGSKIDQEAQATRKRKPKKHAWYTSRPFLFTCVIVIYLAAFAAMIFMDSGHNIIRDLFFPWMPKDAMNWLFDPFGLKPFDVGIGSWFFFLLFTVIGGTLFFGLFFVKNIRDQRIRKRLEQGKPVDQKWLKRFNVKYTVVCIVVGLLLTTGVLIGFKNYYHWLGTRVDAALNLLESMGMMILWIAVVPTFSALVWIVLKFVVFLLSALTSNVAKTMMTTGDYQDFKAAAEASAAARRKDAGLPVAADYGTKATTAGSTVPQTVQVMVDPQKLLDASHMTMGQRPKNDDDHSGDLFPALMVIDRKWDNIHKKAAEDKAAKEKADADQKAAQAKWVADCEAAKKQWDADCKVATDAKKPLPPRPAILSSKSPDQLQAEAELKAKQAAEAELKAEEAKPETKNNVVRSEERRVGKEC